MAETIILQGKFTSDGAAKKLAIRSDMDWMKVYNFTASDGATSGDGTHYYWQRGMDVGTGLVYYHPAGDQTLAVDAMATAGFTLIDSTENPVGTPIAVTSTTNATQPVVATGTTTDLTTSSIVRLSNVTGATNLNGIDFSIDTIIGATSFRIKNALATAPGTAGGAGFYRVIAYDPIYYPRRRTICQITQAASAVITMTVDHGYTVGQEVRINVPTACGMIEMNGLVGTITAVSTGTITVNIDSTAFTAFKFPLPAAVPFTPAEVVPVGEDTAQALASGVNILGDATYNTGYIGMELGLGAAGNGTNGPCGATSDVMYWVAGKSFSVSNV